MSTDRLQQLIDRCKGSVHVTVNEHRSYYQTVQQWIDERQARFGDCDIDADEMAQMVERDTVVVVVCFPDTPVGSYQVMAADLGKAVDAAHAAIDSER